MFQNPHLADKRSEERRVSRFNKRQTLWPTPQDLEANSEPWTKTYGGGPLLAPPSGVWDVEARASRLSFYAGNSLLPPAPTREHQWPGYHHQAHKRSTWIGQLPNYSMERVWPGTFDVEKRESWVNRNSDQWSDFDIEKEKEIVKGINKPLSQEQLDQANTPLVSVEVLKHRFEGSGSEFDPFLVSWLENDPANPMEFPGSRKWMNAMVLAFAVFMVSIASSGFSQGTRDLKTDFNISQTIALLTTSLFVLGFAAGALILSPLSEVYGRRELYVMTFGAFVGFTGATGLCQSIAGVLTLRFLAGLAGSFTQAVAPAVIADIFAAQERGFVLSIFTLAGLMGQMLGPIACGFLDAKFGWRSLVVLIAGASFPTWLILTFTFPETYAPALLQRRAKKLSQITGKVYLVKGMTEQKTIATQLRVGALRPWIILIYEPIVTLLSLFLSVVHGTLFLLFAAYPIVFQTTRGWPQGVGSLPFLAIALGIIISLFYVALFDQKRYAKVVSNGGGYAPPEARLPPAMLGSVALPIGLFWFAWTNGPETFWLISVSAGVFFGFGMVLLYMSLTNYLVDAYLGYAASALAASTVLRSCAGAAFPLFTGGLYTSLGIHWASTVPAFMALVFVPCLVGFYKYGHIIRSKTRFGQEAARLAEMMQGK